MGVVQAQPKGSPNPFFFDHFYKRLKFEGNLQNGVSSGHLLKPKDGEPAQKLAGDVATNLLIFSTSATALVLRERRTVRGRIVLRERELLVSSWPERAEWTVCYTNNR